VKRDALSTPRKTAGPTPCRFRFSSIDNSKSGLTSC
jgi:hypothetical protein